MGPLERLQRLTLLPVRAPRLGLVLVGLGTIAFLFLIPRLSIDPSMEAFYAKGSEEYHVYKRFINLFGSDQPILVVIKSPSEVVEPVILERVTKRLARIGNVARVLSLTSLRLFQERNGTYGYFPVTRLADDVLVLPNQARMTDMRRTLPLMNFLVSEDRTTFGIVLIPLDTVSVDSPEIGRTIRSVRSVLKELLPPDYVYTILGTAVILEAIKKYNVLTALEFGLLAALASIGVSIYFFRSVRVTLICFAVIVTTSIWVAGLLSLLNVTVNTTTSLAFGFAMITAISTVTHLASHYYDRYRSGLTRRDAAGHALRSLVRPCFMCALTTAVGFGCVMANPIPLVAQAAVLIALGVMTSFLVAVCLTPPLLIIRVPKTTGETAGTQTTPPEPRKSLLPPGSLSVTEDEHSQQSEVDPSVSADRVTRIVGFIEHCAIDHYKACLIITVVFGGMMLTGARLVQVNTSYFSMFTQSTKEIADILWTDKNLTPVHTIELLIEADKGSFKTSEMWQKIWAVQKRLNDLDEVERSDSMIHFLHYYYQVIKGRDKPLDELFTDPRIIPELILTSSMSGNAARILKHYVDADLSRIRVSVRIHHPPSEPITGIVKKIRSVATSELRGSAQVHVTGNLTLFDSEASHLVRSQVIALVVALTIITILMSIQLRSLPMGLVSILPNALPLLTVFGIMGWFGISLNTVTVFAAGAALGLAVDDTVHFMTELRRQAGSEAHKGDARQCLAAVFRNRAKPLLATSAVLLLGFLALTASPFGAIVYYGIIGSCAVAVALVGDLLFLPALLIWSPRLMKMIERQ